MKKKFKDPNIFIWKTPDYKQGSKYTSGMPDYMCVTKGRTIWFEVKMSATKSTFNLNDIRESQYIGFDILNNAGAEVYIGIFVGKNLFTIPYLNIRQIKFLTTQKSVDLNWMKIYNCDLGGV